MTSPYTLVGIGASEGGLDAIIKFLSQVEADCDSSFFVVQHLSTEGKSITSEFLTPHVKLPIVELSRGMKIKPGRIYLCPAGWLMEVDGQCISLTRRPEGESLVLPINWMFESMAVDRSGSVVAVILSGVGSDGIEGIKVLASKGSLVAVQDPVEAEYKEMPESAISSGCAGLIAPAGDLWEQIKSFDSSKRIVDELNSEKGDAVQSNLKLLERELQIARENLEAANKELATLNEEYEQTNLRLVELNATHENLLEGTQDGVLYVDGDLRIHRFNSFMRDAFALVDTDVGRHLGDIVQRREGAKELIHQVKEVLETGAGIEQASGWFDKRFYMKRILPCNGSKGSIEGALLILKDITNSKKLEERFRLALETLQMSWWDWDLTTGTLNVASAGSCLLGEGCLDVSRDRDGWMMLVHPEDRPLVESSLNACLSGETEIWHCEHRFQTGDGGWIWVENVGSVIRRGSDGRPEEMTGTTRDIDSYRRTIIDLNGQLQMSDAAGEAGNLGFWQYDFETEKVTWSKGTRRILEVDEDFEPSAEATFAMMPEESAKKLREAFARAVDRGEPYDLSLHFRTGTGRLILTRSMAKPFLNQNGEMVKLLGVFQDVTELTKTQHEMEAYFSMTPDFQATVGFDGVLQSFNESWSDDFGYTKDELVTFHISELVHPKDRLRFNEVLEKVKAGEQVTNHETRILVKGAGEEEEDAWFSWSMASDPELHLVFVSARCITDQIRAKNELIEARIRAENADRAKSDFLAMMSHELRTPLNPILGFAEILMEDLESPEQRDILKSILESGHQMVTLIDEILDYSKVDAGRFDVKTSEFSIADLVKKKIRLMSGMLRGRNIKLYHKIDWGNLEESRSPVFLSDEGMIRQILRNLLSNAIKFTKEGEVQLDVQIAELGSGRCEVIFIVRDTGIGISREDQGKLFEPFIQVDYGTTREFGGTGLGLAICKRMAELLGGTIDLKSEVGQGSTFFVSLPMEYYYEGSAPGAQKVVDELDTHGAPCLRGQILLVDDNRSNAFFIKKIFERLGLSMTHAIDGETGLELIEETTFDLILLDLHMPGIGGLETLKRMRAHADYVGTPIYILTADASSRAEEDVRVNGATGFLTKPIGLKKIQDILSEHLYQR